MCSGIYWEGSSDGDSRLKTKLLVKAVTLNFSLIVYTYKPTKVQANRIENINAFEKKGCSPCLTHYSCIYFLDQSTSVFFVFQTSNINDLTVENCKSACAL